MADTITIDCDPPGGTGHRQDNTGIAIEVDGVVSAQRSVPVRTVGTLVHGDPMVIHWISGALAAGSHRVRVLVTAPHPPDPLTDYYSFCVGSAANDEYQARLSVKELLPVP